MKQLTRFLISFFMVGSFWVLINDSLAKEEAVIPIIHHQEDEVELLNPNQPDEILILRGNVKFEVEYQQQKTILQADEVRFLQAEKKALAKGKVTIIRGPAKISADKCEYNIEKRLAILSGEKVLYQSKAAEQESWNEWQGNELQVEFGEKGIKRLLGKSSSNQLCRGVYYPSATDVDKYAASGVTSATAEEPIKPEKAPLKIKRKLSPME